MTRGDCCVELSKVAAESVDLIFTSPPYANQRASTYGGIKPNEYVEWFLPIADELFRVLKPTGTFVLNVKEPAVDGERHSHVIELVLAMRDRGWFWTEEFIWHKKNCYPGKWPNRFRDAWERLLQFNKQRQFKMNQQSVMVPVGDWYDSRMRNLSDTDRIRDESKVGSGFGKKIENWVGRDMVYPTNVLYGATECSNRSHSATFPLWLPEWFIKLFTDPNDTVLDPFIGSGTTAFAALQNGRNVIGIELQQIYFDEMKSRVEDSYKVKDMTGVTDNQITSHVQKHMGKFHDARLEGLKKLKLDGLLVNKNPYLFRSKNLLKVSDLIKSLLDAHLSSQEETMFGGVLEGLAILVAETVKGGRKVTTKGIDLEWDNIDGNHRERVLVSVKSGPHWGNSSQKSQMRTDFRNAKVVARQNNTSLIVTAVEGCCYGRQLKQDQGDYYKRCGQDFWEFISGDPDLYTRIIEPLGEVAKQRNDEFTAEYSAAVNRLSQEFTQDFCDPQGNIDWSMLVRLGSSSTPFIRLPAQKRQVSQLSTVASVVDVLNHWNYPNLAQRIQQQASNLGPDCSSFISSLRGFLMTLGTLDSDVEPTIVADADGLLTAEWVLPDQRTVKITFPEIDWLTISATNEDGTVINLGAKGTYRRQTATNKLVTAQLLTKRP